MVRKEEIMKELKRSVNKEKRKIARLHEEAADYESPWTSWSSHQLQDMDDKVQQHYLALGRYKRAIFELESSERGKDPSGVQVGSLVRLKFENGESTSYIITKTVGGRIGNIEFLSLQSPVGEAIQGKPAGSEVVAKAPGGAISIKILEISAI